MSSEIPVILGEKTLSQNKYGFRKGKSTIEAVIIHLFV